MSQQPPNNSDLQQPDVSSRQQADSFAPQNVVQGNQNRVVQGNENQSVLGESNTVIQGNNNLMLTIKLLFPGQQTTPVGNPTRPEKERILLAAVKEEVTARLRQSLHNAVLINLGKESQPQQVKRPWDAEIKIGLKPAVSLPDTTTILSVFESEDIAGKLLILGAPGSGKTTIQLELAQELIKRAEEQPDYPVPVLFNLSSWKDDRTSITDWLVAELESRYRVSKKLSQEWINNQQLLPLLDGLDELESQRQKLCAQTINQFLAGETRPIYLVVCSRIEEYNNYSTQLQLNGAIFLQPLITNQIFDYLTTIKYRELWSTISNDLDLLELVKTPLILSITVLASQEISVEEWEHLTSTVDRLQYLLNAYVRRMLTRTIDSKIYLKTKSPNASQSQMWLVLLAQQMQRESKTEFLIEEMQPSWLDDTQGKMYELLLILIFVPIGMFFNSGPIVLGLLDLNSALINNLIILLGIIFWFNSKSSNEPMADIKTVETFQWTKFINIKVIIKLGAALVSRLAIEQPGYFLNLSSTVMGEMDIEKKIFPNQGIWKSAVNCFIAGSLGSLISGLFNVLFYRLFNGSNSMLYYGLYCGLVAGVSLGAFFGGLAIVQHFALRLVLYRDGCIPWNYARFLHYATERLFLQRVGGRYRFIHKLLQDHFAQMEFKRD